MFIGAIIKKKERVIIKIIIGSVSSLFLGAVTTRVIFVNAWFGVIGGSIFQIMYFLIVAGVYSLVISVVTLLFLVIKNLLNNKK